MEMVGTAAQRVLADLRRRMDEKAGERTSIPVHSPEGAAHNGRENARLAEQESAHGITTKRRWPAMTTGTRNSSITSR